MKPPKIKVAKNLPKIKVAPARECFVCDRRVKGDWKTDQDICKACATAYRKFREQRDLDARRDDVACMARWIAKRVWKFARIRMGLAKEA